MTTRIKHCPECGDPEAEFRAYKLNSGRPAWRKYCHACYLAKQRLRQKREYRRQRRRWQPPTSKQIGEAPTCSPCSACTFLPHCRSSVAVLEPVACEPGSKLAAMFRKTYNTWPRSKEWAME